MTAAGKEPGTTIHQVFISYASDNKNSTTSDRKVADQICSALESQNIRCWIAHRNILPGDEWLNAIIDAVEKSKIIVLVFSANTEQSQWVKDEITLALKQKIKIIPFRIENVSPRQSLRILDVRCQWLDAYTPPLEKHIESLVKIVSRNLGLEPAIPIKKETLKEQPVPDQVKPAAKEIKAVKDKIKDSADMPDDVKKVISIAQKVDKNKDGYWEAYYQDGIIMVYIPPGEFMMGQTGEEKKWLIDKVGEKKYNSYYASETPLHKVYLEGYWLGKTQVTVKQYMQFVNETKSHYPAWLKEGSQYNLNTGSDDHYKKLGAALSGDNYPIVGISWNDAINYCKWLSDETGLKFKLPTEAQWEKAARGNDQRKYPWGSRGPKRNLANFSRNKGKTTPVGSYPTGASPYGLLDMAGNVWEWCTDRYEDNYYKNSPQKNPPGPERSSDRVVRGGGWVSYDRYLRCAYRSYNGPFNRDYDLGFRLRQD